MRAALAAESSSATPRAGSTPVVAWAAPAASSALAVSIVSSIVLTIVAPASVFGNLAGCRAAAFRVAFSYGRAQSVGVKHDRHRCPVRVLGPRRPHEAVFASPGARPAAIVAHADARIV